MATAKLNTNYNAYLGNAISQRTRQTSLFKILSNDYRTDNAIYDTPLKIRHILRFFSILYWNFVFVNCTGFNKKNVKVNVV